MECLISLQTERLSMLGNTPIAVEHPTQDGRTLTEQSPLVFPYGAHFQGVQRDVQSERVSAVASVNCRSERM